MRLLNNRGRSFRTAPGVIAWKCVFTGIEKVMMQYPYRKTVATDCSGLYFIGKRLSWRSCKSSRITLPAQYLEIGISAASR